MSKTEAKKYLYIDFEYNSSQEKHPTLICASWSQSTDPHGVSNIWLHKDPNHFELLKDTLTKFRDDGFIMVAFQVAAEARCFEALGLDPMDFKWIDLYLEFKQLQNRNNKYLFGTYFLGDIEYFSKPKQFGSTRKQDNYIIKGGLVGCAGHQLGININAGVKHSMRDLILQCKGEYTKAEQTDILAYCDSDIVHLPALRKTMAVNLWNELKKPELDKFYKWQLRRGEDSAIAATHETEGIPIDIERMKNLRRNVPLIKEKLIKKLNELYAFFVWKKLTKTSLRGKWTFSNEKFKEYIETHPDTVDVRKDWAKTDSGQLSTKDEYLKNFEYIKILKELRQTKKILNQIKWFREPDKSKGEADLFENVGSDNRMRSFMGLYGAQTGRSQPSTKKYIPLMSAWLHCLMRPPKGYVFIPADYSSQEFAIGACLAHDENMVEAYESGDPYLWFGKEAGGIPKEGTKKSHPVERGAFKATTLAVQFGMKGKSLGKKVTGDTGKFTSEEGGNKLIRLHQKAYPKYWKMLDAIESRYLKTGVLQLPCGWALFKDARSTLSALNFPVQGRGSTMLHLAVKYMRQRGLKVIYTKHDEVVTLSKEDEVHTDKMKIDSCMSNAYDHTMKTKNFPIRIDMDVITHEKVWISEKGEDYYNLLHKYLGHFPTREDRIKHLMETVFKS